MLRNAVTILTLALLLALPAAAAKRIALVIGNSTYSHVTPLRNPKNDATLISVALEETGFEVTLLHDLDQRGMKKAMLEFGRKLREGAEASMFYYAGHGIEIDGVNYLVPTDSDMKAKDEADLQNVGLNAFLAQMQGSGVPLNIIVLDACRNNPFRSLRAISNGGLAPVQAPRGTYIAYATAPGSVASDGDSENSPFTEALVQSIREPGLALETVFKRTRERVLSATRNEQLPYDNSAITGEFYFKDQESVNPTVAATSASNADEKAEAALAVAGDSTEMLRVIASQYPETVWARLADAKIKELEKRQLALLSPKINEIAKGENTEEPKNENKYFGVVDFDKQSRESFTSLRGSWIEYEGFRLTAKFSGRTYILDRNPELSRIAPGKFNFSPPLDGLSSGTHKIEFVIVDTSGHEASPIFLASIVVPENVQDLSTKKDKQTLVPTKNDNSTKKTVKKTVNAPPTKTVTTKPKNTCVEFEGTQFCK